jgi:type IV/VI secretion system ImpK/VasF family protein
VLEVYLLCILLGYSGKYGTSGKGELKVLAQAVLARIRRVRKYPAELSSNWRPVARVSNSRAGDPYVRPLLFAAIASLVIMIALFTGYTVVLSQASSAVASVSRGASQ